MTLTQTATITRRLIVISVVLLIVGVGAKIGYQIWYEYQLANLPKPIEKPEQKFGTLPRLNLPDQTVSSSNYSYSVDTQTGEFPQMPSSVRIYFMPLAGTSLLAPDRSRNLAVAFGFPVGPDILSNTVYRYTDDNKGELTIDLPTGNFVFQKLVATTAGTLTPGFNQSGSEIITEFKTSLQQKGLLTDDLKNGRGKVTFEGGEPRTAKTATITLWPADFNDLPIMTASQSGLIRTTITTAEEESGSKYLQMNYTYWPIDNTTSSTYPLKTVQQAFSDLQSGNGFVILEPLRPKVSLTTVYMAYYQSEQYAPYLQPVFVFEGPHFQAIVQATESK